MKKIIKLPRFVWEKTKISSKIKKLACPGCGSSVMLSDIIDRSGSIGCKKCFS